MSVYRLLIIVMIMFCGIVYSGRAESPSKVNALVDSNSITSDEVLTLQLQIEANTDKVVPPDMSVVKDFNSSYLGASRSSSTTISAVNGQRKMVNKNFIIMDYRLTPLKEGKLVIPSIDVTVEGKVYKTEAISINVTKEKPQEGISMLEYKLPRKDVYLGETVPIELVWYFRNNPQLNSIEVPAFSDERFVVSKMSPPLKVDPNNRYFEIAFNGGKYWALQGKQVVNGVAYATLTMKWYIAPKEAGKVTLDPASVLASYIVGYRRNSIFNGMPRDFAGMFKNDPFFSGREAVYKQLITRTQPITLDVKPLPQKNKPANFSGVVSKIELGAETNVKNASVGEPINVELFVSGNDNVYNIDLPDFNEQPEVKGNFKVSVNSAASTIVGNSRKFELVFRAMNPDINEIPPLKIAYYNPQAKDYEEAASQALPIKINAAKMLDADDIEGAGVPAAVAAHSPQENMDGIHENVTDSSALINEDITLGEYFGNNKIFFALFPGCYFTLLLGQVVAVKRRRNAGGRAAGRALRLFDSKVNSLLKQDMNAEMLSEAVIDYFKLKLQLDNREITLSEINDMLQSEAELGDSTMVNFKKIVDYCEACCYTGSSEQLMSPVFVENVKAVITNIDSSLS